MKKENAGVVLKMNGHGQGKIFVDGKELKATEVYVRVGGREEDGSRRFNEVTVVLIPDTVEVDGVFNVNTVTEPVIPQPSPNSV